MSKEKKITGHIVTKEGYLYMRFHIPGRKNPKWERTGLKEKNNKTKAKELLKQRLDILNAQRLEEPKQKKGMLFDEYMLAWFEKMEKTGQLELTTLAGYRSNIKKIIVPYFQPLGIALEELTAQDLADFYEQSMRDRGVKAQTIKRYHANIRKALKEALIDPKLNVHVNVADMVILPNEQEYISSYYNQDDINNLIPLLEGELIELPTILTAFYGLRRSEVLGLQWNSIDFANNLITIKRTITEYVDENGNKAILEKDRTKNKSSYRTLPLLPKARELLLKKKATQKMYQEVCGRSYCKDHLKDICVDELGHRINPSYLSRRFKLILQNNNMPMIRFHDLRHSFVYVLCAAGIPLKDISEWLGHSAYSTTDLFYSHWETHQFQNSAKVMNELIRV